jgi:hypothetical protein
MLIHWLGVPKGSEAWTQKWIQRAKFWHCQSTILPFAGDPSSMFSWLPWYKKKFLQINKTGKLQNKNRQWTLYQIGCQPFRTITLHHHHTHTHTFFSTLQWLEEVLPLGFWVVIHPWKEYLWDLGTLKMSRSHSSPCASLRLPPAYMEVFLWASVSCTSVEL